MATYSSNTTIKLNAAVSATATITTSSGTSNSATVYTAPASTYAIINLYDVTSTSGAPPSPSFAVSVGGRTFYTATTATSTQFTGIYVGPGQAVAISSSQGVGAGSSTSHTCQVSGVNFTNTP